MKNIFFAFILFASAAILSSCVTLGKYEELEAKKNHTIDSLQNVVNQLSATVASMKTNISGLKADSTRLDSSLSATINERNNKVVELEQRIAALNNDLTNLTQNYEQSKSKNSAELKKLLSNLEVLQKDVYVREARIREVEQKLALRDSTLNSLKAKLNDALLGFKDIGLSINIINGRLYVSLSNQLLFKTGKTDIDVKGKSALKELAQVLNTQKDINILVEGHTDDAKVIDLGSIKDNWDLSVLRATEVVRYLTEDDKVDAKRVTASGRGEYFPLDPANTKEARAKNRRTEIILIPKLGELFEIIGK